MQMARSFPSKARLTASVAMLVVRMVSSTTRVWREEGMRTKTSVYMRSGARRIVMAKRVNVTPGSAAMHMPANPTNMRKSIRPWMTEFSLKRVAKRV